jgi:hypothetical protein
MTAVAMQWRAIESAFVGFVKEAIGLRAVFGVSNGVQVDRPLVVFQWLGFEGIGDSGVQESYANNKVAQNYYASRKAQLDVQVLCTEMRAGDNALAYADALQTAFDLSDITKRWLDGVGVAVSDYTGARPIDAVEDGGRYVSRAAFTLKLNLAVNLESAQSNSTIDSVSLDSEIEGLTDEHDGAMTVTRS